MVVALTGRQWDALVKVTGMAGAFGAITEATGHELSTQTGRFAARDLIAAILRPWFETRNLREIRIAFADTGVSWGPYQTFGQLVDEDPRCTTANPMFQVADHPGVGRYLMPRSPLDFVDAGRLDVRRAPVLGEHTEEVLADTIGLDGTEVADLFDRGIVAGPAG
jgi:2-methylfumaryl-CoA isomerase